MSPNLDFFNKISPFNEWWPRDGLQYLKLTYTLSLVRILGFRVATGRRWVESVNRSSHGGFHIVPSISTPW